MSSTTTGDDSLFGWPAHTRPPDHSRERLAQSTRRFRARPSRQDRPREDQSRKSPSRTPAVAHRSRSGVRFRQFAGSVRRRDRLLRQPSASRPSPGGPRRCSRRRSRRWHGGHGRRVRAVGPDTAIRHGERGRDVHGAERLRPWDRLGRLPRNEPPCPALPARPTETAGALASATLGTGDGGPPRAQVVEGRSADDTIAGPKGRHRIPHDDDRRGPARTHSSASSLETSRRAHRSRRTRLRRRRCSSRHASEQVAARLPRPSYWNVARHTAQTPSLGPAGSALARFGAPIGAELDIRAMLRLPRPRRAAFSG